MLVQLAEKSCSEDQPSTSTWVRENFVIGEVIGNGTFGKVYTVECRQRAAGHLLAMKELMRFAHPRYIEMELRILQQFGGCSNIMQMHCAYRDRDRVFILMDHFPHDSLRDIMADITTEEILTYMRNLFIALQHLHKNGVIHRDIKPANFLYNRKLKRYALIDFGLAEIYDQSTTSKENSCRSNRPVLHRSAVKRLCASNEQEPAVKRWRRCDCAGHSAICSACKAKPVKIFNKAGTPGFRAPEILLRMNEQSPKLDVWSAGITMLSMMCRKHPLFRPGDDSDALVQMAAVFGTRPLLDLARESGHTLKMAPEHPGIDLVHLVACMREGCEAGDIANCNYCKSLIFDNLTRCLCLRCGEKSLSNLDSNEKVAFEVLSRCLVVNPKSRGSSQNILSQLL